MDLRHSRLRRMRHNYPVAFDALSIALRSPDGRSQELVSQVAFPTYADI